MDSTNIIKKIHQIRFSVKGIKLRPLFFAKLVGYVYHKRDPESKKSYIVGKTLGARFSASNELIKFEKILSKTTKEATVLITHTRQLSERIDLEPKSIQKERLRANYSDNVLRLSEMRRVIYEAVCILKMRFDKRKYLTQRYLMAFSEKAGYSHETTEEITNAYLNVEKSNLSLYTDLISDIDKVIATNPGSSLSDHEIFPKEETDNVLQKE